MRNSYRLTVAVAACIAATAPLAAPANAVENVIREAVTIPAEPVATCEGGTQVGLGFDIVRTIHTFTDKNGEPTRILRNVEFTGVFQLLGTDEQSTFQGTRIVTFDLLDGTFTSVGNYRTVTQPGTGIVFHSAGREVFDENDALVFSSGPKYDELSGGAQDEICGLFGLDAA